MSRRRTTGSRCRRRRNPATSTRRNTSPRSLPRFSTEERLLSKAGGRRVGSLDLGSRPHGRPSDGGVARRPRGGLRRKTLEMDRRLLFVAAGILDAGALLICIAMFVLSRPVDPMPRPVSEETAATMAIALLLLTSAAVLLLWRTYSDNLDERLNSLHASISAEFHLDLRNELSLSSPPSSLLRRLPVCSGRSSTATRTRSSPTGCRCSPACAGNTAYAPFPLPTRSSGVLYSFAPGSDEKLFYDGPVVQKAERTGRIASGVEVCPSGNVVLRRVMPVSRAGKLVGYAIITKDVHGLLQKRYLRSGSHLVLSLRKELLDRTKWEKTCNPDRQTEWSSSPTAWSFSPPWSSFLPVFLLPGRRDAGLLRRNDDGKRSSGIKHGGSPSFRSRTSPERSSESLRS